VNDEYPVLVGHWRYVFRTKSEGHQPVAAGTVALG
jgi:hypothetical protein